MLEADFYNLVKKLSLDDNSAEKELRNIILEDISSLSIIVKLTYSQIWTSRDKVAKLLISLGKKINPTLLEILEEASPDDLKKWCLFILSSTAQSEDVLKILEINASWSENLISESIEYVASRVDIHKIDKLFLLLNHTSRKVQKSVFNALYRLLVFWSKKNFSDIKNFSHIFKTLRFLIQHRDLDFQYWGIKLLSALSPENNLDLIYAYLKRKKCSHLIFTLSRYIQIRSVLRKNANLSDNNKKLEFVDSKFQSAISGKLGWYLQKEIISQLSPPFNEWEEKLLFNIIEMDNILISPIAATTLAKADPGVCEKLFNTLKKNKFPTLKWKLKAILDSNYSENIDSLVELDSNSKLAEDEAALILECIGKKSNDILKALEIINKYAASERWFLRYKAIEALYIMSTRKKGSPSFRENREHLLKTVSKALDDNNDLIRSRALNIIF